MRFWARMSHCQIQVIPAVCKCFELNCLTVRQVSVSHGQHAFVDTITWDISLPQSNILAFAARTCQELGLPTQIFKLLNKAMKDAVTHAQNLEQQMSSANEPTVVKSEPKEALPAGAPVEQLRSGGLPASVSFSAAPQVKPEPAGKQEP